MTAITFTLQIQAFAIHWNQNGRMCMINVGLVRNFDTCQQFTSTQSKLDSKLYWNKGQSVLLEIAMQKHHNKYKIAYQFSASSRLYLKNLLRCLIEFKMIYYNLLRCNLCHMQKIKFNLLETALIYK